MSADACRAAYQHWLLQYYIKQAPSMPRFEDAVLDAYVAGWHDRGAPAMEDDAAAELRSTLNKIRKRG